MENLMIPAIPARDPGARPEAKVLGRADKSSSFSDYLERKMVAEPAARKNLLGTSRDKVAKAAVKGAEKSAPPAAKPADDAADNASLHALFGQFLAEIRSQAKDGDAGPGGWTFTLPDASLLTKLARDAGMSETETAALMQQFEANQGTIELDSLLATLVNHFQAAQNEKPVTVAETELPMLELILERMGVPVEKIQEIGGKSVTGDNQLDLAKFLDALGGAQAAQPTRLSAWEGEQLQGLLDEAGVSKLMQRALLPERHTPWDNPNQPLQPVTMTLDRLRNLLADGLRNIADSEHKPDIPNLLADLKAIFAEAGFAEKTVGWTPAVQKAVEETYRALLDNVDLASVRVKKVPGAETPARPPVAPELTENDGAHGQDAAQGVFAESEADAGALASDTPQENGDPAEAAMVAPREDADPITHRPAIPHTGAEVARPEQQTPPHEVKAPHHVPRPAPGLEQQTLSRISEGVIRGLRANEHHLILRLYPKELGEVKVEMMVRDNHVAVSFAMENSRVKEVLEKNMDMFQQNLEQQGFTLEECMVSVNQQHDGNTEAWREFVQGWQERRGEGQKLTLAEVGSDVLYLRPGAGSGREAGIDFFA